MKVSFYDNSGQVLTEKEFPSYVTEVKVNKTLLHEAVLRQLANARNPIAHTKTKGEVRGGGRKPFRQKGTGNARQGSTRNPHYAGGGVAFGPRSDRNFSKDMPKKQRRLALFAALKSRLLDTAVFGMEQYSGEAKTKNFSNVLAKMPVGRSYLIFTAGNAEILERVAANLPNVEVLDIARLNVYDVLRFDKVVFTEAAMEEFSKLFLPITN